MARANAGRVAAARALLQVEEGAHVEDVLPELLPEGPDRGLGWYLAMGVLRRLSHVDAALRPHLRQPLPSLDAPVRAALRLGAFEVLYARTKPHAAVHQAVEVAKALRAGRASGLVNAVLRRVRAPQRLSRAESLDHPAWLVSRWDARYGVEPTTAWCEANAEPPPLGVVLRRASDGTDPAEVLRAAGLELSPARAAGREVPGVFHVAGHTGPVPDLPGFAEGRLWVQDAASVAVADLVGAGEGTRVLDACAAPGGKSFRLAEAGAEVTSTDVSGDRLALLRDSAERLHLPVRTRVHDWTAGPCPDLGTFDAVLVDAPCTGLGTVRRHPEIRWRRQPGDLAPAAARQRRILESAAQHVAPGGTLVYAVCSPEPEEGEQVVAAFVADHPEFTVDTAFASAPPADGEDAFQAVRMRRSA